MTTNAGRPGRERGRSPWLARLAGGRPVASRDDIERDAAAELGLPLLPTDEPGEPAPVEEPGEAAVAARPAGRPRSRPRRVAGWARGLVDTESPEARRQRLEGEAAAELGVYDRSGQPAG